MKLGFLYLGCKERKEKGKDKESKERTLPRLNHEAVEAPHGTLPRS
jgi:hypothetical protein